MVTNQSSSGPDRDAPSSDQAQWLTDSRTKIEQNRPLAPAQRALQLREMLAGRTLSDLQELAKTVKQATLSLSQIEERELAVRVRELLSPKELNELVASREFDRKLAILSGHVELLNLVHNHLQPGALSKISGELEQVYQRIINSPNAVGDFFRRQGEELARRAPDRRTGFTNQVKKGIFLALEFPSAVGKVIPLPEWLSKFSHKFRERRTRIEAEERIFVTINHLKTRGNPPVPFIEFAGFDQGAFDALKEKHLPKDAQGNVTSEEFTENVRTAVLRDVAKTAAEVIKNKRDPAKGGDASLGTAADKVLTLTMKELLNPNESIEKHKEEKQNQLVDRMKNGVPAQLNEDGSVRVAAKLSAWGAGTVLNVEFGDGYVYSREGGKLTIPQDKVDENGAPTTDEGRSLQAALTQLPASVKKITVVAAGQKLILGDEVQLPLNRQETPAQLNPLIGALRANPRLSMLRSAQDQTMRGVFRYVGEGGRGVLEWNDNLAQLTDVQGFLGTNGILESASPGWEWRRAQGGGWEKVV